MVRILRKGCEGAEGMGGWGLGLRRGLRRRVPEAGLWAPLSGRTQALGLPAGPCSRRSRSCDFPVCSCALQRDLLLQGRLYISPNWLCFHASLFGKDIKVVISGKASARGREAPACGHTSSQTCPSALWHLVRPLTARHSTRVRAVAPPLPNPAPTETPHLA